MEEPIGKKICEMVMSPIDSGKNKGGWRLHVGERKTPFSGATRAAAFAAADFAIAVDCGVALPVKKPVTKTRTRKPEMAGA